MSRPLRIEFPDAVYHVTSRGDRRESIFEDDEDRQCWLRVLAQGMERFDAQILVDYLMGNHYHFVLHTRSANLSVPADAAHRRCLQAYNRRHSAGTAFDEKFE